MIDITSLLKFEDKKDSIRYSNDCKNHKLGVKKNMGPVVAWNITGRCNYKCKHCYSSSINQSMDELSTNDAKKLIDSFKKLNVPVVLLSGGEPLMRSDLFEIIEYIKNSGIKVSLSTNGSLINSNVAKKLKALNISYAGISIDGIEETNDLFRGVEGAYKKSLDGIKSCQENGIKVGLRFTLNKQNYKQIDSILNLMKKMEIKRICFYHLIPSGRGKNETKLMLSHKEAREVLDLLYERAKENLNDFEILTVANHCDAPYLYMKISDEFKKYKNKVYEELKNNGGNRSAIGIVNIDWKGDVYPDQFSKFLKLGNVTQNDLEDIWKKPDEILMKFRNKEKFIKGDCKICKWFEICGANLRARAYYLTEDMWEKDPYCYLKKEEI